MRAGADARTSLTSVSRASGASRAVGGEDGRARSVAGARLCAGRLLTATLLGAALLAAGGARAESATASNGAHGKQVYEQLCSACHGPYGRGDGPVAKDLAVKPPDFTRPELLAGRSDAQVAEMLTGGGEGTKHTPMVVARTLQPGALRDAIAYIRTLSVPGEHVSVPAGRDIYTTFCWFCHGVNGDGKGPAAASLPDPKPRDFTNPEFKIAGREEEIARTIHQGAASSIHGSKYMQEWGTELSPQQIRDVVSYLKTLQAAKR
jgi:mono/diheme cytochrome c family protein